MVYYFTGTGNSAYIAKCLANFFQDESRFIPNVAPEEQIANDKGCGFVFPVYSWGVPPLVLDFIRKLPDCFWEKIKISQTPFWVVMSCGDEVALAPSMITKALEAKNVTIQGIWSVIMPNNYVLLPGFDIDSKSIEENKLREVPYRILEIAEGIKNNIRGIDVTKGKYAWIKSRLIYPLFKRWGIKTTKWHYLPTCIGCGKCCKICPQHNIQLTERHPVWGENCCSCLACYHICPYHAVAYGKETMKKGQYMFPGYPESDNKNSPR